MSELNDMDEYSERKNKPVKLYRKNEKDEVVLKELSRGMFKDQDSFQEALDHWFSEGFHDTYQEAKDAPSNIKKPII